MSKLALHLSHVGLEDCERLLTSNGIEHLSDVKELDPDDLQGCCGVCTKRQRAMAHRSSECAPMRGEVTPLLLRAQDGI